jgi:hypothetical protein
VAVRHHLAKTRYLTLDNFEARPLTALQRLGWRQQGTHLALSDVAEVPIYRARAVLGTTLGKAIDGGGAQSRSPSQLGKRC